MNKQNTQNTHDEAIGQLLEQVERLRAIGAGLGDEDYATYVARYQKTQPTYLPGYSPMLIKEFRSTFEELKTVYAQMARAGYGTEEASQLRRRRIELEFALVW